MKAHLLVLFLSVIFSITAFCQKERSGRKITSVGLTFSTNYSFRKLDYARENQWIAGMRNGQEIPNSGFTAGINFKIPLSQKLTLETGLLYSDKGYQTKVTALTWVSMDPSFPANSKTVFHYKYLEIPIKINYKIASRNKLAFFGSAGMSVDIFIAKTTRVFLNSDHSHASSKYIGTSKISLAPLFSLGIDYRMSERFVFRMEPIYQHFATSITGDTRAKEYLFSLGLNAGIFYVFKNTVAAKR